LGSREGFYLKRRSGASSINRGLGANPANAALCSVRDIVKNLFKINLKQKAGK
jgi:hypothetical protein